MRDGSNGPQANVLFQKGVRETVHLQAEVLFQKGVRETVHLQAEVLFHKGVRETVHLQAEVLFQKGVRETVHLQAEVLFQKGVRETVHMTYKLELLFNTQQTYAAWSYIGTEDGVFRTIPAHVMAKEYNHRRRPWWVSLILTC